MSNFKFSQLCVLLIGLFLISTPVFSQGIIIDHTCTDITKIPDTWINKVKSMLKVHYAHTSHGEQITVGLERLSDANAKYHFYPDNCTMPQTTQYLSLMDGQYIFDYCETYITPELYWQDDGINITRSVLDSFDINISLWAWCTQLDYYSSAEAQVYLNRMALLESEYPGITFIYMTGNAQSAETNRVARNNQIRQYCRNNNKILFDFADLDCWYNGQQYTEGGIPMEHPHYNGDEAGHTTYESCENKARAFWWLLARIAGWSGTTTTPVIGLDKTQLTFSGGVSGTPPASQTFTISNTGTGTLSWNVSDNASWLTCTPASGTNSGTVTVSVNQAGLAAGSYTGTITVSAAAASNSPQTIAVTLQLTASGSPIIHLNTGSFYFGASGSYMTDSQTLYINNSGSGTLNWNVSDNAGWLTCTPTSGTNSGTVTVSVNPAGLAAGSYTGAITVSSTNASNSPQTVNVYLTVYGAGSDSPPFGSFDTPIEGSTVRSSIPVTGWALDDIGVENVKIYLESGSNLVYIGEGVFIEGARPDIETSFPGYPNNSRAGWGYMMLTNFLPDGGNGVYSFHAVAVDVSGQEVTLGTTTIYCDNANAVKPFGALDSPAQGGIASGNRYSNAGWVLTPGANSIPTDGTTINVYVDGINMGHPTYNVYRSDIAALFPGYTNSNGAGGYFYLDTTAYENGVHSIYWTAADNAGNTDGIGSRYFTIRNTGNRNAGQMAWSNGTYSWLNPIHDFPKIEHGPVGIKTGYNEKEEPQMVYPDANGIINIRIKELERVEIHLSDLENPAGSTHVTPNTQHLTPGNTPSPYYCGSLINGGRYKPLPIGSTLDAIGGVFYWQPGAGFLGTYELVFFGTKTGEKTTLKRFVITIVPGGQYPN